MKSIREWREENGFSEASGSMGVSGSQPGGSLNAFHKFSRTALQNTMGDGAIDPAIRLKLRSKIMELSRDFPEMSQTQLFQSIMSVVGQLLTHGSGSKVVAGGLYNKLNKAAPRGQPNAGQNQTNNSEGMK